MTLIPFIHSNVFDKGKFKLEIHIQKVADQKCLLFQPITTQLSTSRPTKLYCD